MAGSRWLTVSALAGPWRCERARAELGGDDDLVAYPAAAPPLPEQFLALPALASVDTELLGYLREEPALTLVVYAPLLTGAYVRDDKPLPPDYDHPGTPPVSRPSAAWLAKPARPSTRSSSPGRQRTAHHPARRGVVPRTDRGEPGGGGAGADGEQRALVGRAH